MSRAYNVTLSEISAVFWIIALVVFLWVLRDLWGMYVQVEVGNPALAMQFLFLISLIGIGIFFTLISMALPNNAISKYNLNILIDKISNPDYIGWIRFTRNKKLTLQTVKCGPLGQTKGIANDLKADVINDGTYTVTTPIGNQAILVSDQLNTNINLQDVIGWDLIKKHFGVFGYNAWAKCVEEGKTILPLIGKEEEDGRKETVQVKKE